MYLDKLINDVCNIYEQMNISDEYVACNLYLLLMFMSNSYSSNYNTFCRFIPIDKQKYIPILEKLKLFE